ncbi:hypothetical protein [Apilactobacillus xinyiensis]|uniref:Uncharacterized protein n=1 Tax=Apilactobacillus xinyiensis TaxID=2841032 RepID=A0ABT0I286_9LACO|nr:hypothetical protein [Apilactobacillus xinyiensis]MCK8624824.1 hypothetical protein [Apilactobacillus xinyiensis]MCL0319208.1 hypothetical protein [Apilactobacillus xinyiensis]
MKKLIKRTILTAVPVIFGAVMFTSVSAKANTISYASPGLDPEWVKQVDKADKEALSPENIAKNEAQHRAYLQEEKDNVAILKKLGIDPYKYYTNEQFREQDRQIDDYKAQYGVPGSADAKQKAQARKANPNSKPTEIEVYMQKVLKSRKQLVKNLQKQLKATKSAKKHKRLNAKIKQTNKFIQSLNQTLNP